MCRSGQAGPEFDKAVATVDRMQGELAASRAAVEQAEAGVKAAALADREKRAEALVAGKKAAARDNAQESANRALLEARSQVETVERAHELAWEALVATVNHNRHAWEADADSREAAARKTLGERVDALQAALNALGEARDLCACVRAFPDRAGKAGVPRIAVDGRFVDAERVIAGLIGATVKPERPSTGPRRQGALAHDIGRVSDAAAVA